MGVCGWVDVSGIHSHGWTDPSQILHGLLFFKGGGHRKVKNFIGVPKRDTHFMPKSERWPFWPEGGLGSKSCIEYKLLSTSQNGGAG